MATKTQAAPATEKAVLKYVAEINQRADLAVAADPWAQPYRITEDSAKRLVRACAKSHELRLPPGSTLDQIAAARALGPSDAIAILSLRVIETHAVYRTDKEHSERKDNRHRAFQKRAQRDREASLAGVTIGQRIDRALRDLATVSGVTAANLEADRVTGDKEHGIQTNEEGVAFVDDPARRAKAIAETAMRKVEDEAAGARRRRRELEEAA